MFISFLSIRKIYLLASVFTFIAFAGGCDRQLDTRVNESNLNTNTNANTGANLSTPAPSPEIAAKAPSNAPVTLPLLDALLTDESFVNEAKTGIQISDEQIQKLREAARNAVLNLNQEGSADANRSTRSSIDDAKTKVFEVIGREKGERLFSLVQQRWAGQGEDLVNANPNSVPTDTRIVVNAPEYRMDIFRDGKLAKSYKIGIGYPEFPLPTGLRKADTIIFNPTWTPPDEAWVKGKIQAGKKIEAGSKLNPLGPIKIPIGLPSLIHGGKSAARLGTFASHGCVGLTDPQVRDFAMELSALSGKMITLQDMMAYEKAKTDTKEVKLNEAVPVELRYETIVVEDGKLKIFRDVYERGTNTEENLDRILGSFGVSLKDIDPALREKIRSGLKMMTIDAQGEPVQPDSNSNTNSPKSGKVTNADEGKVTRTIKGKKELVFELPQLRGKGYPAAINLK